ncbi:MAG: ribosome silencing factor [Marinilabiliales bacterium]|nr:MAG: ribosome silencing factor [Marinilabiliales bacterium]
MAIKEKKSETKKLLSKVVSSIQDKKGKDIISIDLSKIDNSITNYFVICSASSTTQADAIYDEIMEKVHVDLNIKPFHREGYENSEWILIDYFDLVVHIFLEDVRNFYKLEDLWADGIIKRYQNVD